MNLKSIAKENILRLLLLGITAVLITVLGIVYKQSFVRILPLYISLLIGLLQSRANRFAYLLGGFNSILYAIVYFYLGLYASAIYALVFSCPIQLVTFVQWSKNKYKESTQFRKMSGKQRICVGAGFVLVCGVVYVLLRTAGSDYGMLDSLSSLLGILIALLTMLAYIEYAYLMLPSGIISIVLHIATLKAYPGQITYLVFSLYSLICVTRGFFKVQKIYTEQTKSQEEASHHDTLRKSH